MLVRTCNRGGPGAAAAFDALYRRHRDYVLRVDELKRRDAAPDAITSRVDRTLATAARTHFGAPRTAAWHRPGAWAAAAASAVLAVGVATTYLPDRDGGPVYADIDGSGRIDIADVLALAREGVAQAELDAFARRVVALDPDGTP